MFYQFGQKLKLVCLTPTVPSSENDKKRYLTLQTKAVSTGRAQLLLYLPSYRRQQSGTSFQVQTSRTGNFIQKTNPNAWIVVTGHHPWDRLLHVKVSVGRKFKSMSPQHKRAHLGEFPWIYEARSSETFSHTNPSWRWRNTHMVLCIWKIAMWSQPQISNHLMNPYQRKVGLMMKSTYLIWHWKDLHDGRLIRVGGLWGKRSVEGQHIMPTEFVVLARTWKVTQHSRKLYTG